MYVRLGFALIGYVALWQQGFCQAISVPQAEQKEKCVTHLYVLAQTTIVKYQRLDGLNSRLIYHGS